MLKILLLKLAILQLQLQLLTMPPETPVTLRLGAVAAYPPYYTATSTAEAYQQANPNYRPTFPTIDEDRPDYTERYYARNDMTGVIYDEMHKYFIYLDPNTKIKYTKRVSTNPQTSYEWK